MAAAFTPDDLVISISGDGDGSGTYTDNQASPIVLEQINPTTGAVVAITGVTNGTLTGSGALVLPQQSSTGSNGAAESAVSGEYGSSSEGLLQLSADGQSLVIGGYGVNAAAYNTGEANGNNVYGNAALAQSTSVPGGTYTPVSRVAVDVNADGVVDSSTALLNVFNTNNIRSVATVNGSSFYVSGQGVKGDTTQGVFDAEDGATSATAIDTSTDTREAEIYNNTLYVSRDSKQSTNPNIASYGTEPTSAATATPLAGLSGEITLTAAQDNGINNGQVGKGVYLSPESYFFASATTLYVADSGQPKNGTKGMTGLGDGGLQKWSQVNGTWQLDYTLSSGLNLVNNNTATSGTTGLIGLTGVVNGNSVQIYATNETLTDTGQTYLYGITDQLNATTLPTNETFKTLVTAASDTNIRGVAFAPQVAAVTCYCTGTRILTARGEVAVEDLRVGDMAVTSSGRHRPVRWIGNQEVDCDRHPRPDEAWPVRVCAGALGLDRPARELWVSPGHALCLDVLGEVLVPASALVNGATVDQVEVERVTYWHVELDGHDILVADGMPAESYMDCGNRAFFGTGEGAVDPDRVAATPADYCRPFHHDGALVEAVRGQVGFRARALGWTLGGDPLAGLHLVVDGDRIEAEVDGLSARFVVPASARDVWLASEAAVPRDVDADPHGDRRRLGLCVGAIRIDDGLSVRRAIAIDDPRVIEGWHRAEPDHRWTDGRACLPAELWAGCRGLFFLRVDLAGPAVARWVAPDGLALPEAPATGEVQQRGLRLVHAA